MPDDIGPPQKIMLIGDTRFEITDPLGVDAVFADFYTELRVADGIVYISLAASVADAENTPELRIVSRIRMPITTLANIQSGIQRISDNAAKAREAAN